MAHSSPHYRGWSILCLKQMILIKASSKMDIDIDYITLSKNQVLNIIVVLLKDYFGDKFNINQQFIPNTYNRSITSILRTNYMDYPIPQAIYNIKEQVLAANQYNTYTREFSPLDLVVNDLKTYAEDSNEYTKILNDKQLYENFRIPYIVQSGLEVSGILELQIITETYQEWNLFKNKFLKYFRNNNKIKFKRDIDIKEIIQKTTFKNDDERQKIVDMVLQFPYPLYIRIPIWLQLNSYDEPDKNMLDTNKPQLVATQMNFEWDQYPISHLEIMEGILNLDIRIDIES